VGFKKIGSSKAAPGFDIGDLFIGAKGINADVLFRIKGGLGLLRNLSGFIDNMQSEDSVLSEGKA
jgi:hypothetical protein